MLDRGELALGIDLVVEHLGPGAAVGCAPPGPPTTYVTADSKAQLERYGFAPTQRRPPALVIPLHDVFGEIAGYQLRSDDPRVLEGPP